MQTRFYFLNEKKLNRGRILLLLQIYILFFVTIIVDTLYRKHI